MSEAVRGDTGTVEDTTFQAMLEDSAEQWGEDNLDVDETLAGLEEDSKAEGQESKGAAGTRAMPTDELMTWLEDNNPEGAKTARAMQRDMSRMRNEHNTLQSDMLDVREKMVRFMEGKSENGEVEGADPDALPEGLTGEHVEMFNKLADHLGFVPKSALDSEKTEIAATDYTQSALQDGVEEFGEAFGTISDNGEIELNPLIQARMDSRLESLQDDARGLTPLDVFRLEFPNEGRTKGSSDKPLRKPTPGPSVVRRTSGGHAPVKIFDQTRDGDIDPSVVFERAWALGKRNLR
jgi:hypothetical protein